MLIVTYIQPRFDLLEGLMGARMPSNIDLVNIS
jgi:hypothetical protein